MKIVLWITSAFLIAPLVVIVLYSFNASETSVAMTGVTFAWYHKALQDPGFLDGLKNSMIVSLGTTLLAGLIGVSAALAARFSENAWTRRVLLLACIVPILTPELVIALGSAIVFSQLRIELSLLTVIIGHTSFGVPLFFLLIDSALSAGHFSELIRASRDLGASKSATVRRVVLPLLWPYVVSSAVLIWALSIDEVVLSYFLSGNDQVITLRLYSLLHTKGVSTQINVACVILMVLVVSIWSSGNLIRRKFAKDTA